jgi:hypothetical protein
MGSSSWCLVLFAGPTTLPDAARALSRSMHVEAGDVLLVPPCVGVLGTPDSAGADMIRGWPLIALGCAPTSCLTHGRSGRCRSGLWMAWRRSSSTTGRSLPRPQKDIATAMFGGPANGPGVPSMASRRSGSYSVT